MSSRANSRKRTRDNIWRLRVPTCLHATYKFCAVQAVGRIVRGSPSNAGAHGHYCSTCYPLACPRCVAKNAYARNRDFVGSVTSSWEGRRGEPLPGHQPPQQWARDMREAVAAACVRMVPPGAIVDITTLHAVNWAFALLHAWCRKAGRRGRAARAQAAISALELGGTEAALALIK